MPRWNEPKVLLDFWLTGNTVRAPCSTKGLDLSSYSGTGGDGHGSLWASSGGFQLVSHSTLAHQSTSETPARIPRLLAAGHCLDAFASHLPPPSPEGIQDGSEKRNWSGGWTHHAGRRTCLGFYPRHAGVRPPEGSSPSTNRRRLINGDLS